MPGTSASKPLSAEVPRPTEVRLLGAPRLFANESQTAFASERRFQLLAFLAVQTGRWIPRDRLAVLLWPDREAGAARGNLRTLIHRARRLPGADGLEVAEQVLRWSVRCDVAEFEAAASIGRHDQALALYGGPLLDGLDDHANPAWMEWLGAERARLGSLCQRVAHERLASLNAPDRAALAERLLAMDPMDEAAFEVLLRAEMDRGRPWQAQRLYRAHAQQLAEQLGLEPSRRLRELMHEAGEAARAQPAGVAVMRQTDPATPSQARDAADARAELVGRRTELAELCALLVDPESRCLTLLGPGGVGKSRLAREAVARTAPQFPGAVAWVDLQDLQRPEEVYARLVRQLNLGALNEKEPVGQIAKLIGASRSLLVLDNAEHLEGLPSLLQGLMEACSGLCLLLTSRARLNVNGERLTVLGGLITPEASEDPEAAATFDAVQLFARVARRADPKFELREHVATVACIARQVDGMPLALELAAGWVRLMTPDQIMQDLAGSLDVLERHPAAHGAQAAALGRPEHAKLRDVLAGSFAVLAASEQQALMALSVFEGGFTRESARALSLQGRLGISLPLLAALLDKSLLSMQGGLRYALHPVVQAYASERLAEDPLAQARARDEHAACFARLLAALAPLSRTDSKRLLQGIDPELGNVRAAWQHAVATRRAEILGEMTMALGRYLEASGRFAEGAQWFRHAMTALVAATPEPPRAPWALQRLRLALALMLHRGGHQGEALAVADAGVRAGIADGDLETYLGCLGGSGSALWAQGQLAQAHERFGQALLLAREHHDRHGTGQALGNLAITHQARGENAEAVACSEEALAIARELGNHYLACVHQINLCVARGAAGDHGAAAVGWREAIAHAQVHGLHYHERHAHGGLAGALHSLGRLEEARAQAQVALEGARTSGTIDLQTWMLGLLARIEIAEARYESAMAPLRELVRVALQNGMQVDLLRSARHYAMVRAGLGHRVEAVRILRMVIAHPQTPRDNARQYGPDLEGLKLSAGEEHSVHEAPAPSLDEVLAAIEASAEPVPGGPSRRLNELPAAPA